MCNIFSLVPSKNLRKLRQVFTFYFLNDKILTYVNFASFFLGTIMSLIGGIGVLPSTDLKNCQQEGSRGKKSRKFADLMVPYGVVVLGLHDILTMYFQP